MTLSRMSSAMPYEIHITITSNKHTIYTHTLFSVLKKKNKLHTHTVQYDDKKFKDFMHTTSEDHL